MPTQSSRLMNLIPAGNAVYDSASMTMAAADLLKDEDFAPHNRVIILAGVSTFTWLFSYTLCAEETVHGIQDTLSTISTRHIPRNWVELSNRLECLAVAIALLVSFCAVSSDFFGGLFFTDEIPTDYDIEDSINTKAWLAMAIATGVISGLTTLFTEGKGVYFHVRRYLAGKPDTYKTRLGKYLSYTIGYPIALLGNLEAICEANAAMTDIIDPQTLIGKYFVLLYATPKGISDFFFSGKYAIEAVDDFTARMLDIPKKRLTRQEVLAFFFTAMVAVIVEFPQPSLTLDLLDESSTALPFSLPFSIQHLLGYGVALRDSMVLMLTLFPLWLNLVTKIDHKLCNFFHTLIYGEPLPVPEDEIEEDDDEELKNYVSLNDDGEEEKTPPLTNGIIHSSSSSALITTLTTSLPKSWTTIWHKPPSESEPEPESELTPISSVSLVSSASSSTAEIEENLLKSVLHHARSM